MDLKSRKVNVGASEDPNLQSPLEPHVYIEETPLWRDGTPSGDVVLTAMQWRIWWLACAGKFFEGMVVFMTGIALSLIGREFKLDALGHGMVGSIGLFGILVGALVFGGLADLFGRRKMFIAGMAIFIVFLLLLSFSPSFPIVLISLLGVGLALGCDYPTAHLVISEAIPARARGRMVLGAFSFQAIGAMTGTGTALLVLKWYPEIDAWRMMYLIVVVPAAIVFAARFTIPESASWLAIKGSVKDAERALKRLLHRNPAYPSEVVLHAPPAPEVHVMRQLSWIALFKNRDMRRATIFSSVPWFLQDLGTYGIGIFTPVIIANTLGAKREHATALSDLMHNEFLAAKGAALIDVLLIVGIVFAVFLTDKVGRVKLQILGFVGCAAGLAIAAGSGFAASSFEVPMIFAGFMVFNFMTNVGPNAQTYLIAGEVFPTEFRGAGAGFAASFAKVGAVITAFLFPVLLADVGITALLCGLVVTSLIGALVTWTFRIETRGIMLAQSISAKCE